MRAIGSGSRANLPGIDFFAAPADETVPPQRPEDHSRWLRNSDAHHPVAARLKMPVPDRRQSPVHAPVRNLQNAHPGSRPDIPGHNGANDSADDAGQYDDWYQFLVCPVPDLVHGSRYNEYPRVHSASFSL